MTFDFKRRVMALPFMAAVRRYRAERKAVPVDFAEGFTLRTFPWVFRPEWELEERREMMAMIADADVLIDVGANHGFYAAMADHLGKRSLAIEPEATNLAILRQNAKGRRIEVIPAALGDKSGTATFYGDSDIGSLAGDWTKEYFFRQTVDVVTLDNVVAQHVPDGRLLVKIDVEGFEDAVLAGATQTLRRPSTWLIETMRRTPAGEDSPAYDRVFEIMKQNGFSVRQIGHTHNWVFER